MKLPALLQSRLSPLAWAGIALAALAAAGLGGYIGWQAQHQSITVPTALAQKVLFPIYLPTALPRGFSVDPSTYENREGALLFVAANPAGDKIIFSEQAKPQDFDFAAFNQRSLANSHSVPDAPFTSVIGTSADRTNLLSVQADSTWLIITSKAPQASDYLTDIAMHLRRP